MACTEKSKDYVYQADYTIPTVIVMGSEEDGISENLLQEADARVKIPLKGRVESLNVSVATGIILFEAVRQREFV